MHDDVIHVSIEFSSRGTALFFQIVVQTVVYIVMVPVKTTIKNIVSFGKKNKYQHVIFVSVILFDIAA